VLGLRGWHHVAPSLHPWRPPLLPANFRARLARHPNTHLRPATHSLTHPPLPSRSETGEAMTTVTTPTAVAALAFSPDGSLLLTYSKKAGEEPNLLIHDAATGARRAGFHQRTWGPDLFGWTSDGKVACKVFPDSVQLFDGTFPAPAEGGAAGAPVPIGKIAVDGIKSAWLSPGAAPYSVVTFAARTKSKPGSVCVWAYPPPKAGGQLPVAAKSLQADEARAVYAPDGAAVLVEMSTHTSADNYYGDSRLFLFDRTGRVAAPVPGLKDGPTHDFCWAPKGDAFVVIAGRSPPVATLHNGRTGAPTFSFGTAAFNTARFSPHGRFLMLGGFGNMPGDVTLWDVNKKKPLGPSFTAPCTVASEWSPDGRYLLTTTTRPRLNVDNGYKLWSHRGVLVGWAPYEQLFHAAWRPAPADAYPDRAASPEPPAERVAAAAAAVGAAVAPGASTPVPGASSSGAASPAVAPTLASPSKGSAYVPPHLRKTGGVNVVSEMMKADHKAAGAIKPGSAGGAVAAPSAAAAKEVRKELKWRG
jgi:translation initiation factor 2A